MRLGDSLGAQTGHESRCDTAGRLQKEPQGDNRKLFRHEIQPSFRERHRTEGLTDRGSPAYRKIPLRELSLDFTLKKAFLLPARAGPQNLSVWLM